MNAVETILAEINSLADQINQSEIESMVSYLVSKKERAKIFFAGAGRSGCVVKAFTNRMMHLGFSCHLLGDITVPSISEGDILFLISGSGKTTSLVAYANKAIACKADVLTITLNEEGSIAQMAKEKIVLPGNTRLSNHANFTSIQPIGSTFEQLAWLTCDALIFSLRDALHQTNEDLIAHHANLE